MDSKKVKSNEIQQETLEISKEFALKEVFPQGKTHLHILSKDITLSPQEKKILLLGLDFIPEQNKNDDQFKSHKINTIRNIQEFERRTRWNAHHQGKPFNKEASPFYVSGYWPAPVETTKNCDEFFNGLYNIFKPENQINNEYHYSNFDWKTLQRLMNRDNLVIKPADKNLGVCILSRDDYNKEVGIQLNTDSYQSIQEIPLDDLKIQYDYLCEKFKQIDKDIHEFLELHIARHKTIIPVFYILPKVHKGPNWKGRPILSCFQWITTPFALVVAHFARILIEKFNEGTICKSSLTLIGELQKLKINQYVDIVSMDIESLYPNLYIQDCIDSLKFFLKLDARSHTPSIPLTIHNLLVSSLSFILKNNYFMEPFYGKFIQIRGIAMGSNCSPEVAILVLLKYEILEKDSLQGAILYKRYIDDILIIKPKDIVILPAIAPYLKYNITTPNSLGEVPFLDLLLYQKHDYKIQYKPYQKVLNSYIYPHFTSDIPKHIFKGIIKGETIRYIRLSQNIWDFRFMKICFTLRLLNRDYPLKFIKKNMNEICWIEKNHWMFPKNRDKTLTPITLKLEYNRIDPLRNQVMKCIHDNLNLLPNSTKDKIMITHSLKRKLQSFLAPSNIDKKRRKISENSRHSSNFE